MGRHERGSTAKRAKEDPLARELAELARAREAPQSDEARATLERVLDGKPSRQGVAVAAAAEIVAAARLGDLVPRLEPAWRTLDGDGPRRDRGCRGRTAIVRALDALQVAAGELFLDGARVVQREPVWGGSVDAAAALRSACAIALAGSFDERAIGALVTLLADVEWTVRLDAARALGGTGRAEAAAVLRYKALVGDAEPQVLVEALAGLIALAPHDGLALAVSLLEEAPSPAGAMHTISAAATVRGDLCTGCSGPRADVETRADAAALALGQSRRAEAFAPLVALAARRTASEQRVPLLALGMLRTDEATAHLLAVLDGEPLTAAQHALAALALQRHDASLAQRVAATVNERDEPRLRAALDEAFGPG